MAPNGPPSIGAVQGSTRGGRQWDSSSPTGWPFGSQPQQQQKKKESSRKQKGGGRSSSSSSSSRKRPAAPGALGAAAAWLGWMVGGHRAPVKGGSEAGRQARTSWRHRKQVEEEACAEGLTEWQVNAYYAGGRVLVPALLDVFTTQAFFRWRQLLDLMQEMAGGWSDWMREGGVVGGAQGPGGGL